MDVIIVSKTHMSNAVCIGGILGNGRFVRLLDSKGDNQCLDTEFEVGAVYTITFTERTKKIPPHIEDIIVNTQVHKFTSNINKMAKYLTKKLNVKTWKGSVDVLFDGKLQWTETGKGYISEKSKIPDNSVGFWIPNKSLLLRKVEYKDKIKYRYIYPNFEKSKSLKGNVPECPRDIDIAFVGFQDPIDKIPAGSLVRVSLARWWSPHDEEVEERCYLQLSGWYGEINS